MPARRDRDIGPDDREAAPAIRERWRPNLLRSSVVGIAVFDADVDAGTAGSRADTDTGAMLVATDLDPGVRTGRAGTGMHTAAVLVAFDMGSRADAGRACVHACSGVDIDAFGAHFDAALYANLLCRGRQRRNCNERCNGSGGGHRTTNGSNSVPTHVDKLLEECVPERDATDGASIHIGPAGSQTCGAAILLRPPHGPIGMH